MTKKVLDGFLTKSVWGVLVLLVGFLFGNILGKTESELKNKDVIIERQQEDYASDIECLSDVPPGDDPDYWDKLNSIC